MFFRRQHYFCVPLSVLEKSKADILPETPPKSEHFQFDYTVSSNEKQALTMMNI